MAPNYWYSFQGVALTTHPSLFFSSPDLCKTNKAKKTYRELAVVPPSYA
jgi:hypothetical protein